MRKAFAPGKIILSGEYAVVFGYPGIAIPSTKGITATFNEDSSLGGVQVSWDAIRSDPRLHIYVSHIINLCRDFQPDLSGTLHIESNLPIAKGMGSSSALVIAIVRALLGENCREEALNIENTLTPQNSGLDFTVIWENTPIYFKRGAPPKPLSLPDDILKDAALIDTGVPSETSAELVNWIRYKADAVQDSLKAIGACTERIIAGEPITSVIRDHHKAQVELSVLTEEAKKLIADIEDSGGAAKVIGAGGRADGSGMVLAFANKDTLESIAKKHMMPITFL